MTRKRGDWPTILSDKIANDLHTRFRWGKNDCITWACSVCDALSGVNPAAAIRTPCRSLRDAKRIVETHGGTILSLAKHCAEQCGLEEISPGVAQRGDIVCVTHARREPFGMALAICFGRYAITTGKERLVSVPMTDAIAAWRV